MVQQQGTRTACVALDSVHYCLTAPLKSREWFWGAVLISLLIIGCVESNPGPRPNEAPQTEQTGQTRGHYGSIENRYGRQRRREETAAAPSGCWPFMWWCKGESLSDEETLLEKRVRLATGREKSAEAQGGRELRNECESEDDDLLQDHQVGQVRLDQQSEIELLKEQVKILKSKLEREMEQRKEEREDHEAKVVSYEKIREESVRFHNDLHAKLDETIQQKALAEKQLLEIAQQNEHSQTEEMVDKFNKEFHRRKQLEEDLEREREQVKKVSAALEQEMLKRQQLEQEMRVWQLNREAEVREQNQEHEIQRRQLQQAVEMEVQRRNDVTQELEKEMKQRQEETQRRLRLEVELQEEIQVRAELELEFKQAELQNQILEQELREELRQMERLLTSDGYTEVEVVSLEDREEASCTGETGSDTRSCGEVSDKAEEKGGAGDSGNNENDEEERTEIRELLLEEFQRLQSLEDQEKPSTSVNEDDTRSQNSEEIEEYSLLEKEQLDDQAERDLNTDLEAIGARDSLQNGQQGADLEEINVSWNSLLTDGSGDEKVESKNDEPVPTEAEVTGPDVIIRSSPSEERLFPEGYGGRRKGILLTTGLPFVLEDTLEKQKIYSCEPDAANNRMSPKNDNSDIISKIINFQGKAVTIASLIGEPILPETRVLLGELKTSLSTEKEPVIGCACAHREGPYIPRTLQRNTFLRSDVLNQRTSKLPPIFAISGMTEQELKESVLPCEKISRFDGGSGFENSGPKIVLLNDLTAANDFKDLCNRARKFKTIHWLAKQPDGFEWRASKGNMDVVKQYIDFSKSKNIPSITDLKGETVIVSGKSGEGKSTYMTHLESEIKEISPDSWVIRINMNEHQSLKDKCDVTESLVIEILSSAAGLEASPYASIGKALLTHSLQVTGKVIVLIDIDIRHRDKIHDLLRVLNNMKTSNVVIAADPYISTAIENSLSTLACSLKPLNKGKLQLLLMKLWTTDLPHDDDDNDDDDETLSDEFTAELLHAIGKQSVSWYSPTPSEISMASKIFQKEYMSFLSTKVINLPKTLDNVELYERHIEWELEMYKSNDAGSAEALDSYMAHITHRSMSSLFSEDIAEKILPLEGSAREITDKIPPLCPSLQEYVTAKWFAENYHNHRSFIEESYLKEEVQKMWEIFERILAKQSDLHMSVLGGDIQRVRDLLASGIDVNCVDKGGRTALHIAALKGKYVDRQAEDRCVQLVSLLMDHGIDTSIVDGILKWTALRYADLTASWTIVDRLLQDVAADISDMSYTKQKLRDPNFLQEMLTEAAVNGFTYVTAFILDTGVDINTSLHSTRYSHQHYALVHIASENGHISLLEFLLEKGANANTRIWDNSTPLHLACRQGNKECVVALLRNSALINHSNKKGDTPLYEAVRSGNSDIVQILLNYNAETDVSNKDSDTPLHVACQMNNLTAVSHIMDRNTYVGNRNKNGDTPLDCAIRGGHTALVKYILKAAKSSVVDRNTTGHTPVHLAAEIGDVLMLDYLLQVMPEVNACTDGGDTPLHIASLHGHTDAVAFLLKKGGDSNRANKHGNTALHLASVRGHINAMKTLLESNAQVHATNKEGNTPLHLVCLQGQVAAVRCLVQHNGDADVKNREKNTPLHLAAIKGEIDVIASLIESNCDVNLPDKHGDTILHQCARNGKLDTVQLLVDTGRCNLNAKNSAGETPLIGATKSGFADIVERLVRDGADVNFPTEDGDVPIQLAVRNGDVDLVIRLFRLGADVNVPNARGNTVLHTAVYKDNELLIRRLVQHGADRSIQNSAGYTPLDLAVSLNSNDAIRRAL